MSFCRDFSFFGGGEHAVKVFVCAFCIFKTLRCKTVEDESFELVERRKE